MRHIDYPQGLPFSGDFTWESETGNDLVPGGELERVVEGAYEDTGRTIQELNGEIWTRRLVIDTSPMHGVWSQPLTI